MLHKITLIIMALSLCALGSQVAAADSSQPKELKQVAVSEGFALAGVSGMITRTGDKTEYFFHPDTPLTDKTATIEKGKAIKILESSSLQAIMSAYKEDVPLQVKAWGMLTVFDKTNYAYINYVLPVAAVSDESDGEKPQPDSETKADDVIPQDVLDILRGDRSIDTAAAGDFDSQKPDGIYADKTGFIERNKAGNYIFRPDGLGQNIENKKFYLLKCQTLETVIGQPKSRLLPIRYKVAGITNEFDGRKYILLQRATRVYGYGNLSEF